MGISCRPLSIVDGEGDRTGKLSLITCVVSGRVGAGVGDFPLRAKALLDREEYVSIDAGDLGCGLSPPLLNGESLEKPSSFILWISANARRARIGRTV
jgi:hypothetical protein